MLRKLKLVEWVALIGSVCSIVGVPLAIFFYFESVKSRELTYSVSRTRAQVFRPGGSPGLSVAYLGDKIAEDVTSVEIAVWNEGRIPIKTEHLLEQVKVTLDPPVRVLSTSVIGKSRPTIGLALGQVGEPDGASSFPSLQWDILEQGDGFALQLIYIGDEKISCAIDGVIEGQGEIFNASISELDRTWELFCLSSTMAGILTLVLVTYIRVMGDDFLSFRRVHRLAIPGLVFIAIGWIGLAYGYWLENDPPASIYVSQ